jgi:hypothetical protein
MFSLFAQAQHDLDGGRGNAAELPLDRGPGLPGGGRLEARRSSPSAQRPDNSRGSNNSSPISGKHTNVQFHTSSNVSFLFHFNFCGRQSIEKKKKNYFSGQDKVKNEYFSNEKFLAEENFLFVKF